MKKVLKNKNVRVWLIVSTILVLLLTTVTVLSLTLFYDLFGNVLGKERAIYGDGGDLIYNTEFKTKEDARLNAERINELVSEEGFVLLKNDNNVLPLETGSKISVFGKNSVNLVHGGSGSGKASGEFFKDIFDSLEASGFSYNTTLKSFYESSQSGSGRPSNPKMENSGQIQLITGETPWSSYSSEVINSFDEYSDAAIIMISRIGGEGWDLPRRMSDNNGQPLEGARNADDHYLQLDENETNLLKEVSQRFDKVIVLLNSSAPLELGFLDDPTHYAYTGNLDAAIWIGAPGDTGIMALGRILKGEVNPSGKLPDTYTRDFKKDPSWENFGDYLTLNGQMYTDVKDRNSSYIYTFVDYEEGIYVGYRYYETRGFTDGEDWYQDHVVYPFGYGLSYTTFNQKIIGKASLDDSNIRINNKIRIEVEVENTGNVAGKDAVQVYVTAPYTNNGIEKAHVVLVGVAKTPIIEPGGKVNVEVEIDPYSFASYDYNDKNQNGFKGYELEEGNYTFRLGKNSHEFFDNVTLKVSENIKINKDLETDYEVINRFEDGDDELTVILSRSDWENTFPKARTALEKVISEITNAGINSLEHFNPNTYDTMPIFGENNGVVLADLVGLDYDDPLWEDLLNNLTAQQMMDLFNKGAFQTIDILSIGKPKTIEADGPTGFVNFMSNPLTGAVYGTSSYASQPVRAATFNPQLQYLVGEAAGNEALIGDERGDKTPYSGWYAPGVNIHRSPFGGRLGEYYSEDPYLSGILAAYQIQGASSKGVYSMVKHFAVNEQETSRGGIATWVDEQTLREIYLKPFEYTVKIGETSGMMSAFNRIGTVWTGGDYRLLVEVLRNEWGFEGTVISDFNTGSHMDSKQMAYAGGDLNLQNFAQEWNANMASINDLNVLRNAAKNVLFTVANSNALNLEIIGYRPPLWIVALYIIDGIAFISLATWGIFTVRRATKHSKKPE